MSRVLYIGYLAKVFTITIDSRDEQFCKNIKERIKTREIKNKTRNADCIKFSEEIRSYIGEALGETHYRLKEHMGFPGEQAVIAKLLGMDSRLITVATRKCSGEVKDYLTRYNVSYCISELNESYPYPIADIVLICGGDTYKQYDMVISFKSWRACIDEIVNPSRRSYGKCVMDSNYMNCSECVSRLMRDVDAIFMLRAGFNLVRRREVIEYLKENPETKIVFIPHDCGDFNEIDNNIREINKTLDLNNIYVIWDYEDMRKRKQKKDKPRIDCNLPVFEDPLEIGDKEIMVLENSLKQYYSSLWEQNLVFWNTLVDHRSIRYAWKLRGQDSFNIYRKPLNISAKIYGRGGDEETLATGLIHGLGSGESFDEALKTAVALVYDKLVHQDPGAWFEKLGREGVKRIQSIRDQLF